MLFYGWYLLWMTIIKANRNLGIHYCLNFSHDETGSQADLTSLKWNKARNSLLLHAFELKCSAMLCCCCWGKTGHNLHCTQLRLWKHTEQSSNAAMLCCCCRQKTDQNLHCKPNWGYESTRNRKNRLYYIVQKNVSQWSYENHITWPLYTIHTLDFDFCKYNFSGFGNFPS